MNFWNHTYRAVLVILACSLGIFYSAIPYPRQVTDDKCAVPQTTPSRASLGKNIIPNGALTVNPAKHSRPLEWFPSSYGNNNPNFHYLKYGYKGKALEVNMYDYNSGAANWMFNALPVESGQQYYFSDFYKSNVNTKVEASFTLPDGSIKYSILGFASPSKEWMRFHTTFTVPQGAKMLTVYHFINKNGYLATSNYTLRTYNPRGFNYPMLTLTFDDGYKGTYLNGLPIMNKYKVKSTQFIITSLIGSKQYMTKEQLRSWVSNGHEIGSHTVTHSDLASESPRSLNIELKKSKDILKSVTHNDITDFAYPMGVQNTGVGKAVSKQYSAARGIEGGLNARDNFNCYNLKAQDVHNDTTLGQITDWISQAQKTNTWLILVYHSVEPNTSNKADASRFNVTADQLDSHLKAIKASGIKVKTMAEAINEINSQMTEHRSHSQQINRQNLTWFKD